jgi:hypothetical protein
MTVHAQRIYDIIQLNGVNKMQGIHRVPFSKVIVIDNRFDTTKLKIMADGVLPFHELVFARHASAIIADYIQQSIDHLPRAEQSLYIDLRQLRYGNIKGYLFLSANAYLSVDGRQFKRVLTFRKTFGVPVAGSTDINTYRRAMITALKELINSICTAADKASPIDTNTYQTESLRTNVIEDWAHYPINTQQPSSNGIYLTFDDFLQNKMQKVDFSLRMALDSNYLMDLENEPAIPRDTLARLRKPWGLFFNGMFYIGMNDPHTRNSTSRFFLPLVKSSNTYHFHLPHDLPNMYAILSAGSMAQRDILDNSGSIQTNPAAELIGIAANVAYNAHQNKLIRNKQRNIMTNGLSQDMRECFLDMDSGDIVY